MKEKDFSLDDTYPLDTTNLPLGESYSASALPVDMNDVKIEEDVANACSRIEENDQSNFIGGHTGEFIIGSIDDMLKNSVDNDVNTHVHTSESKCCCTIF